MWSLSTAAKTALVESHGIHVRATVYSPTFGMLELPVSDGQVEADATRLVRRTATLQADPRHWPRSPRDLLAPYGSSCQLEYGIALRSGAVEWVPVMFGLLDEAQRQRPLTGSAEVTVKLVDRAARVADDRLDAPTQTRPGALVTAEIRRLIRESLGPAVAVTDRTGSRRVAAVMEIARLRWADGIERLADAIGAEVYFNPQGAAVIRPQPTLEDPVVWQIATGAAGTITAARDRLSREGVYNKVIASGQRTDGTPPVHAAVWDTDPDSPTFYGGPFGRKPRFYSSPLLTTEAQCASAAAALLARTKGVAARVEFDTLVNPALEPGDVIDCVADDGTVTRHILDTVTVPLEPGETQALRTRSPDLPPEQ